MNIALVNGKKAMKHNIFGVISYTVSDLLSDKVTYNSSIFRACSITLTIYSILLQ